MDYVANAQMLLWLKEEDDDDDIPDYDASLDLTHESRSEDKTDSVFQQSEQIPETREERINWQEQIGMIHLRSHLNKLSQTVTQAQCVVDSTREELMKSRCQIEQYEIERDKLCTEIDTYESEKNRPAVQRLHAAFKRVCKELEAEQTLEAMIRDRLEQAEYELALAEVERGKFILAEDNLLQKENKLATDKTEMAAIRQQKEKQMARQALIAKKNDKRKWQDALNDAERHHIHAIEEAEKSHERANKYLSKTLAKLKKRQEEEQGRYKTEMARKMDMLLKLKQDIANNKENLRVIRARNLGIERDKCFKEQEEINQLLAEGGNAEEMMLIKKRRNDIEKKKQQFEAQQKLKKAMILEKILREEENIKRKILQQPYLFDDAEREKTLRAYPEKKKLPKTLQQLVAISASDSSELKTDEDKQQKEQEEDFISSNSYLAGEDYRKILKRLGDEMTQQYSQFQEKTILNVKVLLLENRSKNKDDNDDEDVTMELSTDKVFPIEDDEIFLDEEATLEEMEENELLGEEADTDAYFKVSQKYSASQDVDFMEYQADEEIHMDLAKPEFEGLWDKQTKAYKPEAVSDDLLSKPVQGSKMEKEILKKTLERTRERIVKHQVAAGKEFSGQPFYSKPSLIHFKDFVVGKSYKKKVTLTNVSYTVNYIRFLEVSDSLKDFITISFEPPGPMSAGLTCEMTVTFKPLINTDLKGEVHFLTQTGPFQIPLQCSTKKCDLSVDTSIVDFGTSVIGETVKRSFVLTNRGSLGTRFNFFKTIAAELRREVIETNPEQSFSEILKADISKEASEEGLGSQASSKHLSQEVVNDQELKIKDTSHASDTPDEENSEALARFSGEIIPVKEILSTAHSTVVYPASSKDIAPEDGDQLTVAADEDRQVTGDVVMDESLPLSPDKSDHELSKVSQEESVPCLVQTEEEDASMLDGMMVGDCATGEIGPYSSLCLEIIWQPTLTGQVKTEFTISFSDPNIEPIHIFAVANAIDVPVWVDKQTVDLRICLFDRLYQDTVNVNNRSSTTMKVQFEVCKELRNHLELLPKTGFIQAHSRFSAQLKFLPRQSLFQEAANFFDPNTGVLEAPITVRVAGQVIPVCFTLQAVVTTSDLEFGICDMDFGCCTIHESVKRTFTLTNKSILPQQFGFVGLPDYLEVQPNDGFGTLLPLETLELDVIFSPKAAKEYKMNLLCRTLINRDFCIPCQGVGVLTPLELSKQVINFRATSIFDTSSAILHVLNNHIDANEYAHPVPRIGAGEIFPVGPTSFEFKVPKDAPISLSPSVGTLLPGQKIQVEVKFSPVLDLDDIRQEAMTIHARLQAEKEEKEREEAAKKEKQEQEIEYTIELKPKKGNKRADINVNNLTTNMDVINDQEIDVLYHRIFDNVESSDNEAQLQNFNESACRDDENVIEIASSDSENMELTDTSGSYFGTNSNTLLRESVIQTKTRREVSKKRPKKAIKHLQTPDCAIISEEITGKNSLLHVEKDIVSSQNDTKSRNLVRKKREVENRTVQKSLPVKNHQGMKPHSKNKLHTRNEINTGISSMAATELAPCIDNENNNRDNDNNNMDANGRDGVRNSRLSSNIRLDEGLEKAQADKRFSKGEFNNIEITEMNEFSDENSDVAASGKKKSSTSSKVSMSKSKSRPSFASTGPASRPATPGFDADHIKSDSYVYRSAITALLREFKGHLQSVTVPCYVASGRAAGPGQLNYSIHNTLYLQLHCPAVKPQIIVVSDEGRRTINFGSISVGQTCSKSVTIQNISNKELHLKATVLDPAGPFQIRNALRTLSPGAMHTILLTFTPGQGKIFQENLGIKTLNSTLHLTLKGFGISPLVNLSFEDGLINMRAVLVGEFVEKHFTMTNMSSLPIEYNIKQDSMSQSCHILAQDIPPFLKASESHKTNNYVGPQNKSGRNVFDIVPATGTINAGDSKELTVTFAPDHESDLFSDGFRIELFTQKCVSNGQAESHFFQVIGQGKSQIIYLEGCDPIQSPVTSLACLPKQKEDEEITESRPKSSASPVVVSPPALITMKTVMRSDFYEPCTRQITVGCVQVMSGAPKRVGEFTIDGLNNLAQKSFTIQPPKGTVEADSKKHILITWLPPPDYDPKRVIEETLTLTLKGDVVTELIPLVIHARIAQSA